MPNAAPESGTNRTIVVFVRAPVLGKVKTRLAAELGDLGALAAYRDMGLRTTAELRRVRDCRILLHHTPDDGGTAVGDWLGHDVARRPQGDGDLGARMAAAIGAALAEGARHVIVVGTDCPSLTAETVERAFDALDSADVVIGPALDGGYYLIGMSALQTSLFVDVPWSSTGTRAITLERARDAGLRVALLPTLRDIDTADDWRAWQSDQARGAGPSAFGA